MSDEAAERARVAQLLRDTFGDRFRLDDVVADLDAPDWLNAGKVHDWHTYIPEAVRAAWDDLPLLARAALYVTAEAQDDAEEWD